MGAPASRRGIIFILSAPSGAGKTTISRKAVTQIEGLAASISVTTRRPREGETEGIDYHFVSVAEFERLVTSGEFAEFARVFDSSYGTPRAPLESAIGHGCDLLLDIDVQGAAQIRRSYNADLVTIFVMPPSLAELAERLRKRATESEQAIKERLARAAQEMQAYREYDYLIINNQVADSIAQLDLIVRAERLKVRRLTEAWQLWKA